MVDYQSRYRLYGLGYTPPTLRYPVASNKELYHETTPQLRRSRTWVHDCRTDGMKERVDRLDWDAWLLAHGIKNTYQSVDGLHRKEKEEPGKKKIPDKLLFNVGLRGFIDGDFNYPRGLSVDLDGNIYVADTLNHRVQILNQFGVFVSKFGSKGKGEGEFNEPSGVSVLPNGDVAVADTKNQRIQVMSNKGKFRYEFPTGSSPYCIVSDSNYNMAVSTTKKTVEVYRRGGKLLHCFAFGGESKTKCGNQICMNDNEEIIVSDIADSSIKIFTFDGKLLYKFSPESSSEGLAVIPGGICLSPLGQVVVADSLNHTVNLYTERGVLLQQLLCPTDDAGTIQTCALGPEGHLIATEFSLSGQHCVKIFRYRECLCHLTRPGSSKRRTPTPSTTV